MLQQFQMSYNCYNFHLLQIPSISHSRQALLPYAVVYLMNLRIPPKPAIKAILKLKLVRSYAPCYSLVLSLRWSRFFSLIWLNIVHFLTWINLIYFPPNVAVMSRPFEFRGRGLAWEIYRDQIIFLTRSPLFSSAKPEEI